MRVTDYKYTYFQVEPTEFKLEVLMCPAGYVIHQHTDQALHLCECNHNEPNILLCEDDQETIFIKVCIVPYNRVESTLCAELL